MEEIAVLIVLNLAMSAAVFLGVTLAAISAVGKKERNETDDWD